MNTCLNFTSLCCSCFFCSKYISSYPSVCESFSSYSLRSSKKGVIRSRQILVVGLLRAQACLQHGAMKPSVITLCGGTGSHVILLFVLPKAHQKARSSFSYASRTHGHLPFAQYFQVFTIQLEQ